jgi:hypothetical protein
VNTRHTPGPYYVDSGEVCRGPAGSPTRLLKANRDEHRTAPVERDANVDFACLAMNAHGDLLAACEAVAAECERQGDNEYTYEIGRTARAAIAAAKGEA